MTAKLSPKQTALLAQIARNGFSFFDDGLVAGSGIWSDALTHEAGKDVAVNPRGAATVMAALVNKGFLTAEDHGEPENGPWVALTEAGAEWVAEYNAAKETAPELPIEEPEAAPEAAPAAATKKARKTRKAKAVEAPETAETPAEEPTAPETPETPYEVNEWAEETADRGTEEWIETKFADGSWTLRRRRQVSGAWRTDFWGQAAGAEKRVFTTSGAAKAARAAGKFVG